MIHTTPLEAKVAAYNRAHEEANRLAPLVVAALGPFKGTKVELSTGGFRKNVKASLPELPCYSKGDHRVSASVSLGTYSIKLDVRATAPYIHPRGDGHEGSVTVEVTVYIAETRDGILGAFNDNARDPQLCTVYTADVIREKRAEVVRANAILSDAKSALYPFSEYDQS